MCGGWWYFYYTICGEKIYINEARKPSKINGFWHLTNVYGQISKGEKSLINQKEMNNIYDNEQFFEQYAQMSRSRQGLSGAGEWHQFKDMYPDFGH